MKLRRSVRVTKKVRLGPGRWQFVSPPRKGNSWVWDPRPGLILIEWWDGPRRRRQSAGETPMEVLHAVRRKQLELAGQVVLCNEPDPPAGAAGSLTLEQSSASGAAFQQGVAWQTPAQSSLKGASIPPAPYGPGTGWPPQSPAAAHGPWPQWPAPGPWMRPGTPIAFAVEQFLAHVRIHSPDKPKTVERYRAVLEHFQRLLGRRQFVEAITRADIEACKLARVEEPAGQKSQRRTVRPATVNFEPGGRAALVQLPAARAGPRDREPLPELPAAARCGLAGPRPVLPPVPVLLPAPRARPETGRCVLQILHDELTPVEIALRESARNGSDAEGTQRPQGGSLRFSHSHRGA
mgnify:CR=1 FL=1